MNIITTKPTTALIRMIMTILWRRLIISEDNESFDVGDAVVEEDGEVEGVYMPGGGGGATGGGGGATGGGGGGGAAQLGEQYQRLYL